MDLGSKVWVHVEGGSLSAVWLRGTVVGYKEVGSDVSFRVQVDNEPMRIDITSSRLKDFSDEFELVKLRNDSDDKDDLVDLEHLHEPAILNCLKERLFGDTIYTNCGPVLVSINPYKSLPIYDRTFISRYRTDCIASQFNPSIRVTPHIYRVADSAYQSMIQHFLTDYADQCVIVSGESGAGKTEAAKYIMQYLATIAAWTPSSKFYDANENGFAAEIGIHHSNTILESFGNARTVKNDNSSRFGKFIEMQFSACSNQYLMKGAVVYTFLLEKTRVARQGVGEQNYHCFYEFLSGSSDCSRELLGLEGRGPDDFVYTSQSEYVRRDDVSDALQYRAVVEAMSALSIQEEERANVFAVLATVLHLGNLCFSQEKDVCALLMTTECKEHLAFCSSLLGITSKDLLCLLCEKRIDTPEGPVCRGLDVEEAEKERDLLAKSIYEALFEYLVTKINYALDKDPASMKGGRIGCINILDIFGFESVKKNSLEQLCINYANERLHDHFNTSFFRRQQTQYELEEIKWQFIAFPDNSDVLDLLDNKSSGMLALCDEQVLLHQATDASLVSRFYDIYKEHPCFEADSIPGDSRIFVVRHYAGRVTYDSTSFLEKNRDMVRNDMYETLLHSDCSFIRNLCTYLIDNSSSHYIINKAESSVLPFEVKRSRSITEECCCANSEVVPGLIASENSPSRLDSSQFVTPSLRQPSLHNLFINSLCSKFRQKIDTLIHKMSLNSPHFVRCIKPNDGSNCRRFEEFRVIHQLRYSGILESARVAKTGYFMKYQFDEFIRQYEPIFRHEGCMSGNNITSDKRVVCLKLCERLSHYIVSNHSLRPSLDIVSHSSALGDVQVGRSKVFLRRNAFLTLESIKLHRRGEAAIVIQSFFKMFLLHKKWKRIKYASTNIQRFLRHLLTRNAVSRREYDAAVTIQKILRGVRIRLGALKQTRAVLLIQSLVRQKFSIRKRPQYCEAPRHLNGALSSSGINIMERPSETVIQSCGEMGSELNTLVSQQECRIVELESLLEQALCRASKCLGVSSIEARFLLLSSSEAEFQQVLSARGSSEVSGVDDSFPSILSSIVPSFDIPAYKRSNDVKFDEYIKAMHALLEDAVFRGAIHDMKAVLMAAPKAVNIINTSGKTVLHYACEKQLVDVAELLVQYNPALGTRTTDGRSSLHLANDARIVKILCEEGMDSNIRDSTGQTPLHFYTLNKLYECISVILTYGGDPNVEDWRNRRTPLQYAASMGDYRLLCLLLYSVVPAKVNKPDFDGNSLLHLVCMSGAPNSQIQKCVMLLLDRGASPRSTNMRGITPLHFLVGNLHIWHESEEKRVEVVQLVQLLLNISVDVNARDRDGCTALVVACAHRKFELCQLLLQNNADMNLPCAMNSYLLRRGNSSEEESVVDGMECTASDLFPPGRKRAEIFAYISAPQTPIPHDSRQSCMNCGVKFSRSSFFSNSKINCRMCGRLICSACVSSIEFLLEDLPSFLVSSMYDDTLSQFKMCIVCGPIIIENFPQTAEAMRTRSSSGSTFVPW